MKLSMGLTLWLIISPIVACGQDRISSKVNQACSGSITFLDVELKYPLTVSQAGKEYRLNYNSNGYFHKTLPFGPIASTDIRYNFCLVFSGDRFPDDVVPQAYYADRIVKGYEFIFPTSINYDSLKTSISRQFEGKKFRAKQKIYPDNLKHYAQKHYSNLDILEINPCVHIVLFKNFNSPYCLTWAVVYFDITEEELLHFYL